MVRALLFALLYAAVCTASFVDYSGVKMPQYGGGSDYELGHDPPASHPSDDYHGHSPDAPASFDYKYEDKPRMKTEKPMKDADELDHWRKSARKQRELVRPPKSEINIRNKYENDDDEEMPKFTTNRRYSKHRSRLKNEMDQTEEETPSRRHKYSRDRKDVVSDIDRKDYLHLDKDYVQEDKNKEFDDDAKFMREITTKRPMRRRIREREYKRPRDEVNDYAEETWSDAPMKADNELEKDVVHPREEGRRQRLSEQRSSERPERTRERDRGRYSQPLEDEEEPREENMKIMPGKFKPKGYDDYDDYYDMKRVHNIKQKLPSLVRRTTVIMTPARTRGKNERKMNMNLLDQLFTHNRRITGQTPPPTRTTSRRRTRKTTPVTTQTEIPTTTQSATATNTETDTETESETYTDIVSSGTEYTTLVYISPEYTTSETTTVSTLKTTTVGTKPTKTKKVTVNTTNGTAELSLAEKSRLSILKKIQRKEDLRFRSTKKPLVLLQVTSHMPTVVIVEPPSSSISWLHNTVAQEDSPTRIELVKKLMRHKLVAEAKSIHDLTNNWDDLVCDYIDTSLLEGTAGSLAPNIFILQISVFLIM